MAAVALSQYLISLSDPATKAIELKTCFQLINLKPQYHEQDGFLMCIYDVSGLDLPLFCLISNDFLSLCFSAALSTRIVVLSAL